MILIITPENREKYLGYLEEMHRIRYEVFVERCGWTNLENPFRMDIDQFDKPWVTYYLKLAPDGSILAGLRTFPTSKPYMLEELYYPLFVDKFNNKNLPHDDNVWEMSRYFVVDPDYRTETGHAAKMELYVAVFEHALSKGVTSLCAVGETYIMARALRLGWKLQPLSVPFIHKEVDFDGEMMAINLEVSAEMVAATRKGWGLMHDVLPSTAVAARPSGTDGAEVALMRDIVSEHPDAASQLRELISELCSECPERRVEAEKYLDAWIARAAVEGHMLPGQRKKTQPVVN